METKDWILLFAPILCNGLVVFLVQFYITERYKRKQEKKQLQNEIYKNLYIRVQALTTGSLELYLQKNKLSEFDEDIKQKNSAMEELLIFCYSNHNAFEDISFRVIDIKDAWDNIYSLWKECYEKFSNGQLDLQNDVTTYVNLVDLIMAWKACSELLKTHIITKL